ncbi:lyase family protein [Kurthia sibirica]|nr:lyase family protein [Kurthia sibirica]GEK32909.1 aspartate ammonia-lyase [Kurthia sibirica]
MNYRYEKDVIGEEQIERDSLLGIHSARNIRIFKLGGWRLHRYATYIKMLLFIKKAAAIANRAAGDLNEKKAQTIIETCDLLLLTKHNDQFAVETLQGGGNIAVNLNINEVIANFANKEHSKKDLIDAINDVNLSQSTADVCRTAGNMAVYEELTKFQQQFAKLVESFQQKEKEFTGIASISRTCLQDGSKNDMGEFFSGYTAVLQRRYHRLESVYAQLLAINIGGTVIGDGEGASKNYQALIVESLITVSNMPLTSTTNKFDMAQNIDVHVEVSDQLNIVAEALIKIAKDLRLLSSGPETGFNELRLPQIVKGSSFFPGKINPVIPETVMQCCFEVGGLNYSIHRSSENGELNLNVFEGYAVFKLLDSIQLLTRAITLLNDYCIQGISVNSEQCKQYSESLIPSIVSVKEQFGYHAAEEYYKNILKKRDLK